MASSVRPPVLRAVAEDALGGLLLRRRTASGRCGTRSAAPVGIRRQIERRLVHRVDRSVRDDQHAERFLRAIERRAARPRPGRRRSTTAAARAARSAGCPMPLCSSSCRVDRSAPSRRRATRTLASTTRRERDDRQVRVGGGERDLPARVGERRAATTVLVSSACARRAQAAAATIGMSAVERRGQLILRRHGRALELDAGVQRRRRDVAVTCSRVAARAC